MALSEKVIRRQRRIKHWCLDELQDYHFPILFEKSSQSIGRVMLQRIISLAGQAMIPEDAASTGLHILDDDETWLVFRREMKLHSHNFFASASEHPTTGWIRLLRNMETHFYRSRVVYAENGSFSYEPEQVDLPDHGLFGYSEVMAWIGYIPVYNPFSNDNKLKSLTVLRGDFKSSFALGTFGEQPSTFQFSHDGPTAEYSVEAEAAFFHARVVLPEPVTFDPNGVETEVELVITVIAEDDTEHEKRVVIS
jgi:hypothetical protein